MNQYDSDHTIDTLDPVTALQSDHQFAVAKQLNTFRASMAQIASYIAQGVPNPPSLPPYQLAYRNATWTTTSNSVAIPWQFSTGTVSTLWNLAAPTKMTVPAGAAYVRVSCGVWMSGPNSAAVTGCGLVCSNVGVYGTGWQYITSPTSASFNRIFSVCSPPLNVNPGDQFETFMDFGVAGNKNVIGAQRSYFAMEILQ